MIPEAKLIKTKDLKSDGNNPNIMSEAQLKALQKNIERYGFIIPIITNKDLTIADGEQRWEVAKRLNMEEVPVIQLEVEEIDRIMLRQILNKLKGSHDPSLDAVQYEEILKWGQQDLFKELSCIDPRELNKVIEQKKYIEKEIDENIQTENECPRCQYKW